MPYLFNWLQWISSIIFNNIQLNSNSRSMICTTKFTIILLGRLPSQRESVEHCKFSSEIWRSPSQNWFSHIVHAVETMLLMTSFWTKLSSYASVCTVIDHKSLDGCSSPWRYIDPWGGCSRSRTCETRIWADVQRDGRPRNTGGTLWWKWRGAKVP